MRLQSDYGKVEGACECRGVNPLVLVPFVLKQRRVDSGHSDLLIPGDNGLV